MKFNQQDKQSIQTLFNQIAPNYDILNNFISFGLHKFIKQQAVRNIRNKASQPLKILDLCTGTGDIAIELQKNYPKAQIIAVDFSQTMLDIAKSRSQTINFIQKDITNLGADEPFEKSSFDICFISFGLRNLPDIDNFLTNIKTYLKPDGILSILDFGEPKWYAKPYLALHYQVIIPFMALIFNKDIAPYKYLTKSIKTYPNPSRIINKLNQLGYQKCEQKNYCFGIISQQIAYSGNSNQLKNL